MKLAVVSDAAGAPAGHKLVDGLVAAGGEAAFLDAAGDGGDAIAELAASLVELERALVADRPDAVVLLGDGDRTLAAAIVAAKLEVPIAWVSVGVHDAASAPALGLLVDFATSDAVPAEAILAWGATRAPAGRQG